MKRTTVITGGKGFIGSHLTKRLMKEGRDVLVVDLPEFDLTDYKQAFKALEGVNTVFHLACDKGGLKYLHGSPEAELKAWQTNAVIDINVFRACVERKVKRIVFPSSSAIYPLDNQNKLGAVFKETDVLNNAEGGYGWVKFMSEIQLIWMWESEDINIAIPRFFNVYGENEPSGIKAHAIYDLCRKAIRYPKEPFVVWGDGKQTRDYMYISDCIDILLTVEGTNISPTNFASGKATSIKEIAEIIIKISGKDIKPIYDLNQLVGPISRTADMTKGWAIFFGWKPKVSLEEGLRRTYKWEEKELCKK